MVGTQSAPVKLTRAALALSVALLALAGCSPQKQAAPIANDTCVQPTPLDVETLEQARKQPGGEGLTQKAVDSINYSNQLASCLEYQAFLARKVSGSLEDVAKAVVTECDTAQARSAELTLRGGNAPPQAEFDAQVERNALNSVLRFRECAVAGLRQ